MLENSQITAARGERLQTFARTPGWRLAVLGALGLVIAEPLARSWWLHGTPEPPAWLTTQPGLLLLLAIILGTVGLVFDLLRQFVSELQGVPYVGALYENGIGVRQRLRERFVPWRAVVAVHECVIETVSVSDTGASHPGTPLVYFKVDCGEERPVMLRETEGGRNTAGFIATRCQRARS